MDKGYKVIQITEGRLGSLFFGGSNIPMKKIENVLNKEYKDGWLLSFMVIETVRNLLFWKRQRVVITLQKGGTDGNFGGR